MCNKIFMKKYFVLPVDVVVVALFPIIICCAKHDSAWSLYALVIHILYGRLDPPDVCAHTNTLMLMYTHARMHVHACSHMHKYNSEISMFIGAEKCV